MSTTPAGWYPQDDGRQRYWDGTQWTEHFAPGDAAASAGAPVGSAGWLPPTSAATVERPWFKKKRFIVPGALVAVFFFFGAHERRRRRHRPRLDRHVHVGQRHGTTPDATPSAAPSTKAAAAPATKAPAPVDNTPKYGTKVRDGKFEFVVTGMKCGIKTVGSEYLNTKAQGEFCRVSMTITNIGDEAQSMFADNQVAFDAKNRKFSADSEASIYDSKSEVLFEEINPGNTVVGRVYFDVPKNTKPVKIELHDSMFSGGVEVALTK